MKLEDIIQELDRRFDLPLREYYERRIIFWQDPEGEFREEIASVKLQNAKVLVLTGRNAFLAKKLLSHDDLTSNYLVYVPFAYERQEDNWLLDLELMSDSFRADLVSMWMSEMKMPDEMQYRKLFKKYRKFFNAAVRREKFAVMMAGRYSSVVDGAPGHRLRRAAGQQPRAPAAAPLRHSCKPRAAGACLPRDNGASRAGL